MAQSYSQLTVEYASQDRIAVVTLNRPQVRNALNGTLIQELTDVFAELSFNEQLHAVILTGAETVFCAGADINAMQEAITYTEEQNLSEALRLADMLHTINTFPCPVIARVNGDAIGGGVGLVSVCDIVIAVEQARFAFSEVKLGIVPAVISPFVIKKIGENMARMLFVTGERFNAERARSIGLVHTVVQTEQLDATIQKTMHELLSGGPQAIRAAKTLAQQVGQMDEAQARHYTAQTIAQIRVSPEGQEGLKAFLEKRRPQWFK
ncbi:enoyl-CoA hydratase-related protein [Dictyobacter arantiisoli]|uniref:Enoyl-CoA hydratase n=1 Tax=Dictyobacter arantiisoli TaxID=2014874 RepID=A0A5A5TF97_9CHLR|nr:enoyl-CoA hydratase-related protein [Dictyobacter arantiisoli]GCF10092.1 enoyl-CoA hydratase [Dictyobacter arantiisoli]